MTKREQEIFDYIENDPAFLPLVQHAVELETQLEALRKLPKIRVHPKDPTKQKTLPAAKLYKEFLQQYINALKVLQRRSGKDDAEEESPLRKWMNEHLDAGQ